MASPVGDLLADLDRGLQLLGVGWYLFGARAAMFYGVARLTADVDVTVHLSGSVTTATLAETLERHEFMLRESDPAFVATTRVLPLVHRPSGLPLDIVLAGPGLEVAFLERARPHTIEGVSVPVASAEDIVVMKALAGRPKDLEDVVAIAAAQGAALDERAVRERLIAIEEALGQSDLIPALDAALKQAQRTRPRGA